MEDLKLTISLITLKTNQLNSPLKWLLKKQHSAICYLNQP
jgi:hypothetical protein